MKTISINIIEKKKAYNVFIGNQTLSELENLIPKQNKKVVLILDFNVKQLFKKKISGLIKKFKPLVISILATENAKSRKTKQEIEDTMFENNCGRDSLIVSIGGGIIGDISGFVASTFNRGIPFINVPTTLLAMVDSSIGGKTGINTKYGKNLLGSFYQPKAVIADLDFIEKLPENEFKNSMAEIIKIAAVLDNGFFEFLEKNLDLILKRQPKVLEQVIAKSIELKKEVVEKDEKESGIRQLLNFGHTIGHGLENYFNYSKKHGYCISIGMCVEARISRIMGILSRSDEERLARLIKKTGLPTRINETIEAETLIKIMQLDKKAISNKPRFILLESIGKPKTHNNNYSFEADNKIIKKALMQND